MTHGRPPDIDRRVRDAFASDSSAIARVVEGALGSGPDRSSIARLGLATAAAVVTAVMLAFWPSAPVSPPRESMAAAALAGSFTDGVLVVSLPDGSFSISDAEVRDDRPPDGDGIVLVEGEIR